MVLKVFLGYLWTINLVRFQDQLWTFFTFLVGLISYFRPVRHLTIVEAANFEKGQEHYLDLCPHVLLLLDDRPHHAKLIAYVGNVVEMSFFIIGCFLSFTCLFIRITFHADTDGSN